LNIPDSFSRNKQIKNFMKILPVAAEVFHVDRRTDRQADKQKEGRKDGQT
jgi:hypothetical protein